VAELLGFLAVMAIVAVLLGYVAVDTERSHLSRTSQRITPDQTGDQPWWPWQRQ
jgi:hypothetical protein